MSSQDIKAPFLQVPWIARLLEKPGVICHVPSSRESKESTEDSLMAEVLKGPRTVRSCISFYQRPTLDAELVPEVITAMTVGDGMNGHPGIIHGGITATMCDEAMGIYQYLNYDWAHMRKVRLGYAEGELPSHPFSAFTADLRISYLKPVRTPGALILTTKRVKKEGRKEWLRTELKQFQAQGSDGEGEIVVCAIGEALFIEARRSIL